MRYKYLLLILLPVLFTGTGKSQSSSGLQIGTQIPLIYSVGYEYKTNGKFAFNVQTGILTKPFDKAILSILKMFGTDEAIVSTIGDAFNYGFVVQPAVKYIFNKYYAGISFSNYTLVAKETPKDAIQNYYGVTLPPRRQSLPLSLKSNLSNVGVSFGRRFSFENSRIILLTEISLSKTFYSGSKLMTDSKDLTNLSTLINKELNSYYIDYGYLPSINLFVLIPL